MQVEVFHLLTTHHLVLMTCCHARDSVADSWHSSGEGKKKKKTQHTASVDNEFKGNNY